MTLLRAARRAVLLGCVLLGTAAPAAVAATLYTSGDEVAYLSGDGNGDVLVHADPASERIEDLFEGVDIACAGEASPDPCPAAPGRALRLDLGDGDDILDFLDGDVPFPADRYAAVGVEARGGSDMLEIVAAGPAYVRAGTGDDFVDASRAADLAEMDCGAGTDTLVADAEAAAVAVGCEIVLAPDAPVHEPAFEFAVDGAWLELVALGLAAGDARGDCRIDDGPWEACAAGDGYALDDGEHLVQVRRWAQGMGGPYLARGLSAATAQIDTIAPAAPVVVRRPPSTTANRSAEFELRAEEPVTWTCTLDGSPLACDGGRASVSGLADGDHRFTARVSDAAGNASAETVITWRVTPVGGTAGSTARPPAIRPPLVTIPPALRVATRLRARTARARCAATILTRCVVEVSARVRGRRVVVMRGETGSAAPVQRLVVPLKLTRAGRRILRRGPIPVVVRARLHQLRSTTATRTARSRLRR